MKIYISIFILFIISSCVEKTNEKNRKQFDRLSDEGLYKRQFLNLNFSDSITENYEIYITKEKDTLYNQYKYLKGNIIDTLESIYYDLKITKTNRKNSYKGVITLHSLYENLKLDKNNRRELQFGYCVQNKDSVNLVYLSSKSKNTIEFEYENYYNNKLQGILYQQVERDTIIDNEKMINMSRIYLLVDNDTLTDNLFLTSYEVPKTKKFTFEKSKFKLNK
ncbi:hypothetical protein FIA58_002055 [Flavobacterium jejuense]|uniref:Lipoprotein n=1 Tax=Flavobacterium jejuense TaxID=1544455 RepID=A0ABX0IQP9_9FLAO|nr:hypothetical protein [Flavobacterium jejuense]NHN24446.1 hypothetical protein [Flavobacterium jejuense]